MGYFFTVLGRVWETAISALAGHLTLGLGGIVFLGFPTAFWGGAYGYAIAAREGISFWPACAIGILAAGVIGIVFAFFYSRLSDDSFSVVTLASVLAMEAFIRSWDSFTGGVLGIAGVPRPDFAPTLGALIALQAVLALAALAFESVLIQTPFGRSLRGLRENKPALTALGTSAVVTGQIVVVLASLLLGMAGILGAMRIQFLDPSLGGMVLLVQILTISIVANKPKTSRLFLITCVIVLIPELLRFVSMPAVILGYARNFTYAFLLIVLLHYVLHVTSHKRHV